MSYQETDISWQVLRRIVRLWAGDAAELAEVKTLVGGCINTTLALTMKDGGRAVLKIAPHRVSRELAREAHQLEVLRNQGLPVPQVYNWHMGNLECPHSYVLMEFMEGMDLIHARQQAGPQGMDQIQNHLAEIMIAIHSRTADAYCRELPGEVQRFANWPEFYRHVYDPIWRDVAESGELPPKLRKQIARIHEKLDKVLMHDDKPRLVHWDVWATNVLAAPDSSGNWRVTGLLDPNCKYAHAEAEIAYMELFHTITPTFLKRYQEVYKLGPGYHQVRKWVYQLYPLLNHVHLFGSQYLKPLTAALEKAAAAV